MRDPKSDYDSGWKEITYKQFAFMLLFFFPHIYEQIDWSRPPQFLDEELQKITPEAELGRRFADHLVKVWLLNGLEMWVLIHIEVQSQYEQDFPERIYIYHSRIFNQYNRRVASLVILGDERADWRPQRYESELLGCRAILEFPVVKLLDYQNRLAELEQDPNPLAVVVMAHLQAKATQGDMNRRRRQKMRLARLLFERGYDREAVIDLFRFILWVLRLPENLENEFRQELEEYQEERAMVYLTSYDELVREEGRREGLEQGLEQGLAQGLEQGLERGKRINLALVQRFLTRQFGNLDPEILLEIEGLSGEKLESLSEALFDFEEVTDLRNWLSQN